MSLRLWLPLNDDLVNKGLEPGITVTNNLNLVTFMNDGKLGGQCAVFNGNKQCVLKTNYYANFGTGNFSIAFWLKIDSASEEISTTYPYLICSRGYAASAQGFAIIYSKSSKKIGLRVANGSNNSWLDINLDMSQYFDKWVHIIAIKDNNLTKHGCFYINGQKYDLASTLTSYDIGNNTVWIGEDKSNNYNPLLMQMQDVRIYDHALSDKEAKELAKGLILHYKLNDTYLQINTNILPDTNVPSLTKVKASYNRYFANKSTSGWTATWKFIEDPPVAGIYYGVEYNITTAGTNHAVCWYDGGTIPIQTGKIYTVSCYVKRIEGTDILLRFAYGNSPYYANDDSTNQTPITIINDNEWHLYSWTFTAAKSNQRIYAGTPLSIGKTIFCGWKLEEGNIVTPWCETNFSQKATTKVLDLSGYNNNGIVVGSLICCTDSPKYNSSIYFTDSAFIKKTDMNYQDSYWTICCWFKKTSSVTTSYEVPCGFTRSTGADANKKFAIWVKNTLLGCVAEGTSKSVAVYDKTLWHYVCLVNNNKNYTCYLDGVSKITFTNSACFTNCTDFVVGGRAAAENATSIGAPWGGDISDVRFYATALSADDVKELYETSVSIDNKSNIYSRQFEENDLNKISITNRGQLQMDAIEEDSSTASFYKDTKEVKGQLIYEY